MVARVSLVAGRCVRGLSLEEAMEGEECTAAEARREVERHGQSWAEFVADNRASIYGDPERCTYNTARVLEWLGY